MSEVGDRKMWMEYWKGLEEIIQLWKDGKISGTEKDMLIEAHVNCWRVRLKW